MRDFLPHPALSRLGDGQGELFLTLYQQLAEKLIIF
jgi:hypothetical protein